MFRERRVFVGGLLLNLILVVAADAQSTPAHESLLIGPGDQIRITVFEDSSLSQSPANVTDAGTVKLKLGGEVHVGGATPIEAAREIEDALRRNNYVRVPHVTVEIVRYATQMVSVLGAVRTPAAYPIDTPRSVIDVLALAGGLGDGASRRIVIRRKDNGEKILYEFSNSVDTALDNAPPVYPGDEVFVPNSDKYYMIGDFNRPGAFANTTDQPTVTLLQLLALAGSTPPTASPAKARLIRKNPDGTNAVTNVNISAMQKGKQPDMPLQPDDVIYVPFSYLKNVVVGIGSIISSAASASVYRF